jgi:Fic family protein
MPWNWQNPDWPNFTWDRTQISGAEEQFLLGSGVVIGVGQTLERAGTQPASGRANE